MRNVMVGNRPIECVSENALFPKYNRHKTEGCEKSSCEHSCLNDRICSCQPAASSITREKEIDAQRNSCYRSRLFKKEGAGHKPPCCKQRSSQSGQTLRHR